MNDLELYVAQTEPKGAEDAHQSQGLVCQFTSVCNAAEETPLAARSEHQAKYDNFGFDSGNASKTIQI